MMKKFCYRGTKNGVELWVRYHQDGAHFVFFEADLRKGRNWLHFFRGSINILGLSFGFDFHKSVLAIGQKRNFEVRNY